MAFELNVIEGPDPIKHYGFPGPGGSLGECAVCGNSFVAEIVLRKPPISFQMEMIPGVQFYAHDPCMETMKHLSQPDVKEGWRRLPEAGILYRKFREHYERGGEMPK